MESFPSLVIFLSILVTTFNKGFFSYSGFAILIVLDTLLVYFFIKESLGKNNPVSVKSESKINFNFVFIVIYSLFIFFSGGIYEIIPKASMLINLLPLLFFPVVLTYLINSNHIRNNIVKLRFNTLILLALSLRILMIIASPAPIIDVFTILKEAPYVLLQGANPYNAIFSQVYQGMTTNYFPYWPASFLLQIPFVWLFNDPRVLLVITDIGSALLIYRFGKKTLNAEILSLIYLFRPNSNFIIEQSWLTPLSFFLVVLALYLLEKEKNVISGITLAVLVSLQPFYVAIVPFIIFSLQKIKYFITFFFLTLIAVTLPFFLWSPANFMEKTIYVYFKDAKLIPTIPVYLSLNMNTFYYSITGRDISSWILMTVIFLIFVLGIYFAYSKKRKLNIVLILVLFFLNFFIFFRQAFINYYYFVAGLIILWMAKKWSL